MERGILSACVELGVMDFLSIAKLSLDLLPQRNVVLGDSNCSASMSVAWACSTAS